MSRSLSRLVAILALTLSMFVPATMVAQDATPDASPIASPVAGGGGVEAGVAWLIDQQQEDGSFLGFSGDPDVGTTVDAVFALVAADEAGIDVGDSVDSAVEWMDSEDLVAGYVEGGTGAAAKLTLMLKAVGDEDMAIGGVEPLTLVVDGFDAETGLYGFGLYDHSYALMALAVTDSEINPEAISTIETMQADNGGFAWDGTADDSAVDSNTTAMVVQALAVAGEGDSVIASALSYLRLTVNDQGAAYSVGAEADSNSTALVAQAFLATDEDATHLIQQLASFQNGNGAYFWMTTDPTDNLLSTVQAIPAGVSTPLPVVPGLYELEDAA